MKKVLFFAAIASFAFAACSKDDVKNGVVTPELATSYAKISIAMPSVAGTRAEWGENFDGGLADEAAVDVTKLHLVFYDDNGMVVGTGEPLDTTTDFELTDRSSAVTDNVSDTDTRVFKLTLYEGATLPSKVAAFVNTDSKTFNLDDLTVAGNEAEDYLNADKKFVMTSAGYYKDGVYTVTADLASDGIYSTASGAAATEANLAATINVERLAAKIKVAEKTGGAEQNDQLFIIKNPDGDVLTPTFNTTNWAATGKADKMYLLKKDFSNDAPAWMNGESNGRSYWAEGYYWNYKYLGDNETDSFLDEDAKNKKVLTYVSYSDVTGEGHEMGAVDYVLEHTYNHEAIMNEPLFSATVTSTSAIVVGNYTFEGTEEEYEGGFYLLYAGVEGDKSVFTIYTKDELIEYLVAGNELFEDENGTAATPTDIKKVDGKFQLDGTFYTRTEKEGDGDPQEYEYTEYTKTTNARHYVDGEGYFFVPIEHYTTGGTDENGAVVKNGYYGVVRNHSYVLTINAINGLAAPMDDDYTDGNEEEPIVPNPDDLKEAYIKATINVLSWHVVGQNVTL